MINGVGKESEREGLEGGTAVEVYVFVDGRGENNVEKENLKGEPARATSSKSSCE